MKEAWGKNRKRIGNLFTKLFMKFLDLTKHIFWNFFYLAVDTYRLTHTGRARASHIA